MVCFASSALQGAPSRLGGVAIPLFRLCVPPPPQLTLQAVHAVQGPQTQSNGFASAKGKEAKKLSVTKFLQLIKEMSSLAVGTRDLENRHSTTHDVNPEGITTKF